MLRHFTSPALPIEYKIYFTIDGGENWVNSGVNIPLRIANRYDNLAEIVTFDENHQSWVMIYGGFNFLSNSSARARYLVRISN